VGLRNEAREIDDMTLQEIKTALRNGPYAWPGGYPTYFVDQNGDALSHEAVRSEWSQVVETFIFKIRNTGWNIAGIEINWENANLTCEHTGKRIPSAYAEPEEEAA
jgi:hypothetical protein